MGLMNPVYVKMLQWVLHQLFGTAKGKAITAAITTGPFADLLKDANPITIGTLFGVSAAVFTQNKRQTRTDDTGNKN